MPQGILRNIREDRDGNIWFASYHGPIRYDGKTFTNFGEEAGIAEQRIFSLLVDKSGALWFGSVIGGASKYDGKSFTRFTTEEGLSGNHISRILEDERGDVWFATTDGGVSRYDGKTFTRYSTKDGLPHDSVHVIAQDRSGKLRTRPPELFGREPLYITVAITLAASSTGICNHFDCAI